ncbi:MAG TPA: hypothetical protein VGV38_05885 [Pyrinomonadaceae bacterium]|nr:hypothetical protein [Pyrinomonadaceae bacterium]
MSAQVCNIGPRERTKRRLMGIASLAAGAGLAFVLVAFDAPQWSRLLLFVPFWFAGLGLFQAQQQTCIALAARGTRNMDAGEVRIDDPAEAAALRDRARAVNRKALIVAVVATVVAFLFPQP